MLMQNFGVTKAKSIVVCYGIFCSDQYKKSRTSLFILEKRKRRILGGRAHRYLFGCSSDTADVLTASRNTVKLHFARLK